MTFNVETLKVTDGHKALSAYIKRETGKAVKPESVSLVLTLQAEFRKDPDRVAERDAVKAAARERQLDQFRKIAAKAQALAEKLGIANADFDAEVDEALEVVEEPVATVTPIRKPKAATKPVAVVPDPPEDDGFEDDGVVPLPPAETRDTDAIQVVESDDEWQADADDEGEDF